MKRVGGQALFHGVLMRAGETTATAVRTQDGIAVAVQHEKRRAAGKLRKLPVLRGLFALGGSLKSAVKSGRRGGKTMLFVLLYAAVAAGLITFETWLEARVTIESWLAYNAFVLGTLICEMLVMLVVLRITPPFRRLFGYHAAEHMAINCYESGQALTVENVRAHSRIHPRCGTNLVANVMIMICCLELFLPPIRNEWLYYVVDLAATLLIFGIAYEAMRYQEKHQNCFSHAIGFCGGIMQKYLTTCVPTDAMLECGIAALKGAIGE